MTIKFKTEIIYNYRKENGLTVEQFCKKCGITQKSYYKIMRNELHIRIATYVKILNVLRAYGENMLVITE